jgi:hypothetical protein
MIDPTSFDPINLANINSHSEFGENPPEAGKPVFSIFRNRNYFYFHTLGPDEIEVQIGEEAENLQPPKPQSPVRPAPAAIKPAMPPLPQIPAVRPADDVFSGSHDLIGTIVMAELSRKIVETILPPPDKPDKFKDIFDKAMRNIGSDKAYVIIPLFLNSDGEPVALGPEEGQSEETKGLIKEGKLVRMEVHVKINPGGILPNFSLLFDKGITPSKNMEDARLAAAKILNNAASPFIRK